MRDIKNKNIKWWIGITSCILLFVLIGTFSYMKMSFILHGVQIQANIDHEGSSPLAIIRGKAEHATHIALNGREIFIDKNGNFVEPIVLIPGFSVITIDTEDKFGEMKKKQFQLVYKESAGTVAFNSK